MTRQEQIDEMAVIGCVRNPQAHTAEECAKCDFKQGQCNAYRHAEALYDVGCRKIDRFEEENERLREINRQLNADYNRSLERLKSDCREIAELKAKLEKIPLAIKQKMMEEDDYELTEREQATLFLDRMGSDVEILHDIVGNLDELLAKGINEYIMGIDGVEGLKDMWERAAVKDFAEKVKAKSYVNNYCREVVEIEKIDELIKEI